ncbi:MAG: alanine racemase, partial [Saprospiraceae bacterium]|nr:alanine racemase [Saprospiraceae bacterium]
HSELAIFEAGISTVGEMANLGEIIQPKVGIFTNIGSAHAEGFSSLAQKLEEKIKLFTGCKLVVCCRDHDEIFKGLISHSIPVYSWSMKDPADLNVSVKVKEDHTSIIWRTQRENGEFEIPFSDLASIENAIHCLASIKAMALNPTNLASRFSGLLPIAMRLEAIEGINGCVIINDVYNADLESLNVAMSFAGFQAHHRKRTLILTDLLQQAPDPDLYAKVAALIVRHGFTKLIGIGAKIPRIQKHLDVGMEYHFFPTTEYLLAALDQQHFYDQLILIKGARVFRLERVTNLLSQKTHQTVLEINLGALARNLKVFEQYLVDPEVKIMAMVKAAAYGSGSIEIARFLESRNLDYLAVAYIDEGVELRKAGIKTPILVLNADLHNLVMMVRYALEPEIFSIAQLETVAAYSDFHKINVSIHIKVETGMNRLGFSYADLESIVSILRRNKRISIKSIFSHLAASEDPSQDAFTLSQLDRFKAFADQLTIALPSRPLYHVANSSAIIRFPQSQFSMVRIGIGMYGIGMPAGMALENVHTLKSFISQIKLVDAGATIGYGRTGVVTEPRKIATIAIGYADGLIRKAGNGRYAVIVNDARAPIIGNICMDMTMIDVTGIEGVSVGSEVTVFGTNPTVSDLAHAAETIPYEVFTNLSSRIKRVYTYD